MKLYTIYDKLAGEHGPVFEAKMTWSLLGHLPMRLKVLQRLIMNYTSLVSV